MKSVLVNGPEAKRYSRDTGGRSMSPPAPACRRSCRSPPCPKDRHLNVACAPGVPGRIASGLIENIRQFATPPNECFDECPITHGQDTGLAAVTVPIQRRVNFAVAWEAVVSARPRNPPRDAGIHHRELRGADEGRKCSGNTNRLRGAEQILKSLEPLGRRMRHIVQARFPEVPRLNMRLSKSRDELAGDVITPALAGHLPKDDFVPRFDGDTRPGAETVLEVNGLLTIT